MYLSLTDTNIRSSRLAGRYSRRRRPCAIKLISPEHAVAGSGAGPTAAAPVDLGTRSWRFARVPHRSVQQISRSAPCQHPVQPVVAAAHIAFMEHGPWCLSPDVIWLMICQRVACLDPFPVFESAGSVRVRKYTHLVAARVHLESELRAMTFHSKSHDGRTRRNACLRSSLGPYGQNREKCHGLGRPY
jgi:hypothetical protein